MKVGEWKGEIEVQSRVGRVRNPSPFDDAVKASYDNGKNLVVRDCGEPGSEQRQAVVKELRRAAAFHGIGLDIWALQAEGVVFRGRDKRKVSTGLVG